MNPKQEFVTEFVLTRAEIAQFINDAHDVGLAENSDRLTDEICQRYADRYWDVVDDYAALDDLALDTLREMGFDMSIDRNQL